jgi:hypothetical protein
MAIKDIDSLIESIAAMERFNEALVHVHAAATYRQTEIVSRSLENGALALAEAIKLLAQAKTLAAKRLLHVAWFYSKFASDILAAEATEHLLGQDQFLDLIQPHEQVRATIDATCKRLQSRLDYYENVIATYSDQIHQTDQIHQNVEEDQ